MNWEYMVLDTRKNSCNELMHRVIVRREIICDEHVCDGGGE